MEIENFKDLTGFMYDEYERLTETFGLDKVPKRSIRFIEKSLRKRTKLYDKPLLLKEKRKLELDIAFDTMPHGFFWKLFHSKLWKKMQFIMENEELESKKLDVPDPVSAPIQVPAVIVEKEIVEVSAATEQELFNQDFD